VRTFQKAGLLAVSVTGLVLLAAQFSVARDREFVKVEVTESTEKQHVGESMLHLKEKVRQREALYAIIAEEHIVLLCKKDNCDSLGPGVYNGERHGSSVQLDYQVPLTNKVKRIEYQISGTW
jgi:hypothetical protein